MQPEEVEKNILCNLIYDDPRGELLESSNLKQDHFYKTVNRKIFKALCELHQEGLQPQSSLIFDKLKDDKDFQLANSNSLYLISIHDTEALPANFDYYINLLKDSYIKRIISDKCLTIENKIRNNEISLSNVKKELQALSDNLNLNNSKIKIVQLSECKIPEERQWLLSDLIPLNFPTTLYSAGGTGKSYLAIDLAINACLGNQTFLDYQFYNKPLTTLFVDFELDESEVTRRSYEIALGLGLDRPPANFFYYSPKENILKLLNNLPSVIKQNEIKFIILDSIGAGGLDSFDPNLVSKTYNELRDLGITSLVIDHQAKTQAKDNPDSKTPFGSVYKFNMSRSVLQLKFEQLIDNGMTLKLMQKKSNFGKVHEPILIDIIFENEAVIIKKSESITQEIEEMLLIRESIEKMQKEQEYINQKDLIGYFKNTIGKDRLIKLLKMGEGKYWIREKGLKGSSFVYIPLEEAQEDSNEVKFGNSDHVYN